MKEVKVTLAMAKRRLLFKAGSVEEVSCANVMHLLKPAERKRFAHELYRVLKKGGKAQIVMPHWCASKYYGNPDIPWPPVTETTFYYLNKDWRKANGVTGWTCDFDFSVGYGMHPAIVPKTQEYQHHALSFFKEAAQDMVCTLTKR